MLSNFQVTVTGALEIEWITEEIYKFNFLNKFQGIFSFSHIRFCFKKYEFSKRSNLIVSNH